MSGVVCICVVSDGVFVDAVIDSVVSESSMNVVSSCSCVVVIAVAGDDLSIIGSVVESSYSVINIISVDELVPSGVKAFVVSTDDIVVEMVVVVVVDVVVF